ncbi:MAG: OmpP1/FadL family transporter [Bacteroidales bacterium]
MKKVLCVLLIVCGVSGALWAQGEMDALKYGRNEITGTARYMGMAGAFTSLGGDMSAVSQNPAGIGIYRSSEVVTTLNLGINSSSLSMNGHTGSNDLWRLSFNNLGYVGTFISESDGGLVSFNVGASYQKVKSFNRNYSISGGNYMNSLSDYMAYYSNGISEDRLFVKNEDIDKSDSPYRNQDWLSVLGYNGYGFDPIGQFPSSEYQGLGRLNSSSMIVQERGGIDEFSFTFGGNVSNVFYFGGSFNVSDINYRMNSEYEETFSGESESRYKLFNSLETRGVGYSGKLGIIVRPTDEFRIGVAFHTPTWYFMSDYYDAEMRYRFKSSSNNEIVDDRAYTPYGVTDYSFRSPYKFLAGMSYVFGQKAIFSVDYDFSAFQSMSLSTRSGSEYSDNQFIKEDNKLSHTVKAGFEYRVTPEFSVRFGSAYQTSPSLDVLINNDIETYTTGTVPHYTVDKGTFYGTMGAGYRFGNMFFDAAFALRSQTENFYPYSSIYDASQAPMFSPRGSLTHNTYNVVMTLGYKF